MAIDTQQKRHSVLALFSPWRGIGTQPTGAVGGPERLAIVYRYSGIEAGPPPDPPVSAIYFQVSRRRRTPSRKRLVFVDRP